LNGLNAAASIAPTLIGQRQIEIERERERERVGQTLRTKQISRWRGCVSVAQISDELLSVANAPQVDVAFTHSSCVSNCASASARRLDPADNPATQDNATIPVYIHRLTTQYLDV